MNGEVRPSSMSVVEPLDRTPRANVVFSGVPTAVLDQSNVRPSGTVQLPGVDVIGAFLIANGVVREEPWNAALAAAPDRAVHHVLTLLSDTANDDDDTGAGRWNRDRLTRYQADQIFAGRMEQLVVGPYIVLSRLGRGGMAEVLKAYNRDLDRIEALKLLRPERIQRFNIDLVSLVKREGRLLASLMHPNITSIFRADENDGVVYLAMEFVRGETLEQLVKRQRNAGTKLGFAEGVEIGATVARALAYAHECNVVHRDVKPGNVMVTPNGFVKVLDVGIAGLLGHEFADDARAMLGDGCDEHTLGGMGTPMYMAPEQCSRTAPTPTMDVYALGCTLFFLLTGHTPFAARDAEDLLVEKLENRTRNFRALCKAAPPGFAGVLARAMDPKPERRFQTMTEFAAALYPYTPSGALSAARMPIPWFGVVGVLALALLVPYIEAPTATFELLKAPSGSGEFGTFLQVEDERFRDAAVAEAAGRHIEAAELYVKFATLFPEKSAWLRSHAAICWQREATKLRASNPTLALEYLTFADRLSPESSSVLRRMGDLYVELDRFDEADRAFRRIVELDPETAEVSRAHFAALVVAKVDALAVRAEFDAAVGLLRSKFARAWTPPARLVELEFKTRMNWARLELPKSPKNALLQAEAAAKLQPQRLDAVRMAAAAQTALGAWAEAFAAYRRLAQLDPAAAPEAAAGVSDVYAAQSRAAKHDTRQAAEHFASAVGAEPGNAPLAAKAGAAWNVLGVELANAQKLPEAVAAFQRGARFAPRSAQLRRNLGAVYSRQEKFAEAFAEYSRAVELDPDNHLAFGERGKLALFHLNDGDWGRIRSDLQTAVRLDAKEHGSHFALGYLYANCPDRKFRDGALAVRHAQKACELTEFKRSEYLGVLAAALAEAKRFDDAVVRLNEALKLASSEQRKSLEPMLQRYRNRQPPP